MELREKGMLLREGASNIEKDVALRSKNQETKKLNRAFK